MIEQILEYVVYALSVIILTWAVLREANDDDEENSSTSKNREDKNGGDDDEN